MELFLKRAKSDSLIAHIDEVAEKMIGKAFEESNVNLSERRIDLISALKVLSSSATIRMRDTFTAIEKDRVFRRDNLLRNGYYNLGRLVNAISPTLVPSSWDVEQTKKMIYFLFCFREESRIGGFAVKYFSGWEDRNSNKLYSEGCKLFEEDKGFLGTRLREIREEAKNVCR